MHDEDKVFFDLLKVAEVIVATQPKMLYKGQVVEVLEQRPSGLSTIRYNNNPDDTSTVKSNDLKPLPASLGGEQHVEQSDKGTASDLAAYCQSTGYRLYVMVTGKTGKSGVDPIQEVENEYASWAGESLPDEAIVDSSNNHGGNFFREWTVETKYSDTMKSHVPIILGGTVGKGSVDKGNPRGIREGSKVAFRYAKTVEELVRAGLRAGREIHWD